MLQILVDQLTGEARTFGGAALTTEALTRKWPEVFPLEIRFALGTVAGQLPEGALVETVLVRKSDRLLLAKITGATRVGTGATALYRQAFATNTEVTAPLFEDGSLSLLTCELEIRWQSGDGSDMRSASVAVTLGRAANAGDDAEVAALASLLTPIEVADPDARYALDPQDPEQPLRFGQTVRELDGDWSGMPVVYQWIATDPEASAADDANWQPWTGPQGPEGPPGAVATEASQAEAEALAAADRYLSPRRLAAAADRLPIPSPLAGALAARDELGFFATPGLSGARIEWALPTATANLATSPVTVVMALVTTATNTSARGLWFFGTSPTAYGASSLALWMNSADLVLELVGATTADWRRLTVAGVGTLYPSRCVEIAVSWSRTAAPTIFINGVAATASETTNGTAPAWTATMASAWFVAGCRAAGEVWLGRFAIREVINRAWSAADAALYVATGEPSTGDGLTGSVAEVIATRFAASALTVGAGDANAAGPMPANDGFGCDMTRVAGARTGGAGSWVARWTRNSIGTGSNSIVFISAANLAAAGIAPGSSFTLTFWARKSAAAPALHNASNIGAIAATTSWAQYTVSTTGFRQADLRFSTNGNVWPQGEWIEFDDVEIVVSGAIIRPVVQSILVADDGSGNAIGGRLAGGAFGITLRRDWRIVGRTSTNGNQQLLGGDVFALANRHRIRSVVVNNRGAATRTVSLGSASAGTQYASAVSAPVGLTEVTPLARFNATGALWVNSNGTDELVWTINGDRLAE